jgi:acetyl esterase/lipase
MMGKKWMIAGIFFFFWINLPAQERYQSIVFDEISKETLTYTTKDGENLDLDIYLPQNDVSTERPAVIYVHGGGFSGGSRDSENIVEFCNRLAGYGYVAASISYRLTRKGKPEGFGCECPRDEKLNTIYAAVEDLQDATFFLIENREQFGIDPQKIILAGSSAGAETVLATAYQPPYCYGLESGPVSIAGVISMAGAIVDTTALYDESAVPSLLFHGTDDPLVPYGTAAHHYCSPESTGFIIMHGAHTIVQKLHELHVPYWLHTSCGAGHEVNSTPMTEYFDVIADFCYNYIVKGEGQEKETIVKVKPADKKFPDFNICAE